MSDEESFVILGSSFVPSMEINDITTSTNTSNFETDTPGSRFTSLKLSQINDLQNAQEIVTQTGQDEKQQQQEESEVSADKDKRLINKSMIKSVDENATQEYRQNLTKEITQKRNPSTIQPEMAETSIRRQNLSEVNISKVQQPIDFENKPQMDDTKDKRMQTELKPTKEILNQQNEADIKLWSKQQNLELLQSIEQLNLEELALKSPTIELEKSNNTEQYIKQKNTNSIQTQTSNSQENIKMTSSGDGNKTTTSATVDSNLAASFILGDVDSSILKTSVYSQFPSISMSCKDEEVVKLQNMVTEYNELKETVAKANITMKRFHQFAINWQNKIQNTEDFYKQQLEMCRQEIEMLRRENQELKNNFKAQIEAVEVARRKDRDETVQIISEKNALLENLRTQIVKLEQQQLASFDVVYKNQKPEDREEFQKFYITRREHNEKVKELEGKLSELLASNLSFKDIEKQYIDELNCLKVNLTAAEELIKEHKAKINELQMNINAKQQRIEELGYTLNELSTNNIKQNERITLLEHQTEVHRKDFEAERESRQIALKEKQQLLQDLRNLQRHNQELIEKHQQLAIDYEERTQRSIGNTGQRTAASGDATSYINNPQRPIRVSTNLPSTSTSAALMHYCPVCNKAFKSLNILQSHVNDCLDKK